MKLVRVALLVGVSALTVGCAGLGVPATELEWQDADGRKAWKLEPDIDEVELEDASGITIAEFAYDVPAISFESRGRDLRIERGEGSWSLFVVGDGSGVTHKVAQEPDGDLRLEDARGNLLYKVKSRDYGYKVVDASDREQRVRQKPGKISIRGSDGKTWLSTRDPIPTVAATPFAMSQLSIEIQTALALGLWRWSPPE